MLILALDTSSAAGSAAVVRHDTIVVEREGDGSRTHGERLPRELMGILQNAGAALRDVDAFAVITGPGSFTGLRVGIATIQGLALAHGKPVAPVTSFESLARIASAVPLPAPSLIAVWIDAHRGEVFAALYEPDGERVREGPTSLSPGATLDAWRPALQGDTRIRFIGNGAERYAEDIRARLGERARIQGTSTLAAIAGRIAAADPSRLVNPHAVVPLYVRRSDAELARDRRAAAKP
jgi:tRNA threonylcarbamoyladenosine biosynthesis protein TsaB